MVCSHTYKFFKLAAKEGSHEASHEAIFTPLSQQEDLKWETKCSEQVCVFVCNCVWNVRYIKVWNYTLLLVLFFTVAKLKEIHCLKLLKLLLRAHVCMHA